SATSSIAEAQGNLQRPIRKKRFLPLLHSAFGHAPPACPCRRGGSVLGRSFRLDRFGAHFARDSWRGETHQSRKATLLIALDWPSVFIRTRCHPCRTMVL